MVRWAPSARVPTSITVVTGCTLSNWNSHPTRTRIPFSSVTGLSGWKGCLRTGNGRLYSRGVSGPPRLENENAEFLAACQQLLAFSAQFSRRIVSFLAYLAILLHILCKSCTY